jgi:hypothetical protein
LNCTTSLYQFGHHGCDGIFNNLPIKSMGGDECGDQLGDSDRAAISGDGLPDVDGATGHLNTTPVNSADDSETGR